MLVLYYMYVRTYSVDYEILSNGVRLNLATVASQLPISSHLVVTRSRRLLALIAVAGRHGGTKLSVGEKWKG